MSKRKRRRDSHSRLKTNSHHLLYQRRHWDKNGYALALRNKFIFEIPVSKHDDLHAAIHDIPLPDNDELERMYRVAVNDNLTFSRPSDACEYLASIGGFEPFVAVMKYQAEVLRGLKL